MSTALAFPAPAPVVRHRLVDYLDDTTAILDTLEGLEDDATSDEARAELTERLITSLAGTRAKVDSTARVLATLASAETAAKAECDRLAARAKYFARQSARLESYVLAVMEASGLKKLEGATATLAIRVNPPAVVIDDPLAIPYEFLRSPALPADVPDKKAIADAWKSGVEVAGTHVAQSARLVRS